MTPDHLEPQDAGQAGIYRGRRRAESRDKSPAAAAVLSFLWPGLGQAYAARYRRALFFALPPIVLAAVTLGAVAVDATSVAVSLLAPAVALAVIGLLAVHAAWRVVAIVDAWRTARPKRRSGLDRSLPLALALTIVVVAAHAAAAVYVQSFAEAGQRIFQDERPEGVSAIDEILGGNQGSPSPGTSSLPGDTNGDGVVDWNDDGWIEDEPGASDEPPEPDEPLDGSPAPTFDPSVTPPPIGNDPITGTLPAEGPINVLFVGLDSGLGRDHSLSDSLIVASYYRDRDTVTMISIPRDTGQLPLYKGGTYPRRINTFLNYARANPDLFPEGPIAALMREIGYLLGTTIHFYAATNLDGLPRVVDLVGGVDVVLDRPIADPKWNLYLEPGSYHLDGKSVMPYVRSRYGPGNSDFQRARRQQQVIKAVATRAKDPTVAARLPEIIDAMSEVVRTNVPRDQVKVLMRILDKASDASTEHIVLSPLRYARRIPVAETGGRYMIELNIAAVRELSLRVFGPYSRYR